MVTPYTLSHWDNFAVNCSKIMMLGSLQVKRGKVLNKTNFR